MNKAVDLDGREMQNERENGEEQEGRKRWERRNEQGQDRKKKRRRENTVEELFGEIRADYNAVKLLRREEGGESAQKRRKGRGV